jgi:hypothetical protein
MSSIWPVLTLVLVIPVRYKCYDIKNQIPLFLNYRFLKGDSGSPLVQYVNNRAVLIGVHKGSIRKLSGKCGVETAVTTRVSKYIDWIIQTIRNN